VASSDKRYIDYPGMKHEIVCELEKEKVWADISNWIKNHL